ncbi:hypothetical protein PVAP13_6KG306500 [Panicum virgatum]|uniref:Uncharacterized protein n=1 Tax=Panicum virgatum TaxID=38727 RepID=A0A8T0RHD3_PANVG|nr:hypothetical protein PVAP13_6KG306500 [Panicum virgatum]
MFSLRLFDPFNCSFSYPLNPQTRSRRRSRANQHQSSGIASQHIRFTRPTVTPAVSLLLLRPPLSQRRRRLPKRPDQQEPDDRSEKS